jgi:hypothetical protein
MSTPEELAAFEGGFDEEMPADQPAPNESAPSPDTSAETPTEEEAAPVDELANLPPRVRAMLEEFDTLKQAAAAFPQLEHRLRSAEGRVAALQKPAPAATPPAPQRMEAVERVRRELPEVVEAMEEFFQSRQPQEPAPPAQQQTPADIPTPVLSEEVPDWEQKVISPEFTEWMRTQPPEYRAKVEATTSEAVLLAAITKFDVHQSTRVERESAAAKVAQTRQSRAAAAAVPQGSGRRAPSPSASLQDEFEAGFRS